MVLASLLSRYGRTVRVSLFAALVPAVAGGAAFLTRQNAQAEDASEDKIEQNERCAVRLSMALLGDSPDAQLLGSEDPQSAIDAMVENPAFAERFARFFNSEVSGTPTDDPANDPVYFLAHHVIAENKPWSDLFIGPYGLTPTADGFTISNDPNGAGYFRSLAWRKKFAGNEEEGTMIVGAFRMIQNTTGLELNASVDEALEDGGKADRSADGRKAPACKGCHYDAWYALDKVALLLPRREGTGDTLKIVPRSKLVPQQILGTTIKDDKDLLEKLVESEAFKFNQCHRVFKFLYGRSENQCEAKVFDACVDALEKTKNIKSAVAAVAKDPSFCTN